MTQVSSVIRNYIVEHEQDFIKVITDSEFAKHFQVKGTALKRIPKGFKEDHELLNYIMLKSWYVEFNLSYENLMSDTLALDIAQLFAIMQPLNQFLSTAIHGYKQE